MLARVLVDVSGSMSDALQLDIELKDQSVTRAQSIFSTIINIVQQENGFENEEEIFVLAFGLQVKGINTCDLLALLDDVKLLNKRYRDTGHECLNEILIDNGAPFTGVFIKKYLSQEAAGTLFETFSQYPDLLNDTINNLPVICKSATAYDAYISAVRPAISAYESTRSRIRNFISFFTQSDSQNVATRRATVSYEEEQAKKHIELAMESAAVIRLKDIIKPRKRPLYDVVNLLREVATSSDSSTSVQEPLTAAQLSNLVNAIKPFIYGDTPMCEALGYALETFQSDQHTIKVLFVLSDGEAKDGDPVKLAKQLHKHGVIVFACLLTSKQIHEPKRLYDAPDPNWSKEERDMFAMSSVVSNEAMEILSENQWKLPTSGQSNLFLHANHPKVIEEFSSLVRQIAERKDVLLDMLGYVSLDLYINCKNNMFDPKEQQGETCYAYAVAAVFHLAVYRIRGREGDVPKFEDICEQLIKRFGDKPTKTEDVLKEYAPLYRLRYKKIENEVEARQAINARHPLVATFRLTDEQWD